MARQRIVIMGRPNVGKSTLFNRLIGQRRALVHDEPGVTRDRLEMKTDWWVKGRRFPVLLTDTGGVGGDRFAEEIDQQVGIALRETDAVIVVFDAQSGVTAQDREIVRRISRAGIHRKVPVIAAVNKVDAESHESLISDFYSLGIENILTLSAEHGRGIEDLEEALADALGIPEEIEEEQEAPKIPRIAIVGRPNVGKSTLVNALVGQERMITSPIAGTTVDAVDSLVELNGKPFIIVDTAGIRRKSKTEKGIEVLSVVQARKALENADVAILMLDGEKGTTDQDEKIGSLIEEAGCGVILAINKWDTQRRNQNFTKEVAAEVIRKKIAYLNYAPILFLSAKEGRGFQDLGDLVMEIIHQKEIKIPTHEFTEWIRKESTIHNPMNAKFYLCHQTGRFPPTFVCHVNHPDKVHFSLRRHFVNALRARWGFMGSPIRMLFVQGGSDRRAKTRSERQADRAAKYRPKRRATK